jgi:enamine deaminase RidA (YjgF/YER057c/UK114 family)
LPNKKDFEPCWAVFQKWLGSVRPAATMFEAGLINDDIKIEIQVTAKKRA